MGNFKKGDVGYHKATFKRCVVAGPAHGGGLIVTTEDGERKVYESEELWTEEEWNTRNQNLAAKTNDPDVDPYE